MIIFGKQVCLYVLEKHSDLIEEIYLGRELERRLFARFAALKKPIIKPDNKKLQALAKGGNHQGFALKLREEGSFGGGFGESCGESGGGKNAKKPRGGESSNSESFGGKSRSANFCAESSPPNAHKNAAKIAPNKNAHSAPNAPSTAAQLDLRFFKSCSKIAVLVGVSDVGNIGSIFRSALSFGIEGLVFSNSFSKSGVARTSSGAFFDMPFLICADVLSLANELKQGGFRLFGSSPRGGKDLRESVESNAVPANLAAQNGDFGGDFGKNSARFSGKWALFLGSEGEGLSGRILGKMDEVLSIETKHFDSLNLAVAAGILMFEMTKKSR